MDLLFPLPFPLNLTLNYRSEIRWILILATLYSAYQFTSTFINVLIGASVIMLIFILAVSGYIIYKLTKTSNEFRQRVLNMLIDMMNDGLNKRLSPENIVGFIWVIWDI